jgi:hypothetical protein
VAGVERETGSIARVARTRLDLRYADPDRRDSPVHAPRDHRRRQHGRNAEENDETKLALIAATQGPERKLSDHSTCPCVTFAVYFGAGATTRQQRKSKANSAERTIAGTR